MALTNPTVHQAQELFRGIEAKFPTRSLGSEQWYILAVSSSDCAASVIGLIQKQLASISAGGHPGFAANLYEYLISKPEYATSPDRQRLMRRLRETLVKLVSVVGVPKPLEAIFCMAEIEKPEDRDYSFSREHWQSGEANRQRGMDWLTQIYRHNHSATQDKLAAHKDFNWLSEEITYGLYLSDHTVLDAVETELVVLSGIMMQNLPRESGWHLRGTRRIGVSMADVETIQQCIETVATFCGLTLNRIPRVKDIEHEVASASD